MTFLWANMLWLLVLLPLLFGSYLLILRRKKRRALRYGALGIVKEASGGRSLRRHIPPLLMLAGTAVLIVAVARPAAFVSLPSERGTVILTMDISGSMRAGDIEPSRIEAALEAARAFIAGQPRNVRVGVVAFAATATLVQAPTTEREAVLASLSRFHLQRGTAVGAGILTALSALFEELDFDLWQPPSESGRFGRVPPPTRGTPAPTARRGRGVPLGGTSSPTTQLPSAVAPGSNKSSVIVVLSDGQTNTGPDPMEAAARAADLGVRVFTVGLGTTRGNILGFGGRRMRVQLDEEALKGIAQVTAARYYRADSSSDLREIYRTLSTQLTLEKGKSEITAIFAAAGAGLMLLAALLSLLWFARLA